MNYERSKLRQDILDIVSKQPGIGSNQLAKQLTATTGLTLNITSAVISQLAKRKRMIRTRVHDDKEIGLYRCWMTVPPNMKPEDFDTIKRVTKNSTKPLFNDIPPPIPLPRLPIPQSPSPIPIPQSHDGFVTSADMNRAFMGLHPPIKPGTFTVELELPNGTKASFTLDEARRMYEQLYRLFGANGL